jgi:hypothetical protein
MASTERLVPALPAQRFFDEVGLSPARRGLALAAGLFALFLLVELGLGRAALLRSPLAPRELRIALVLCLLTGFVPAALAIATRGLRRHAEALRPLLGSAQEALDETLAAAGRLPVRAARIAGAAGVLCGLAVPFSVDRDPSLYLQAAYWGRSEAIFTWTLLPFVSFALARTVYVLGRDSRGLSTLAARLEGIDLLDLGPLAPFSRHGLRVALVALVLAAIMAILIGDRGFGPVVGASALLALLLAGAALLLPALGVQRRLRAEKARELACVRAALRGERGALEDSRLRNWAGTASLADLVFYEGRIASVPEWPFDTPTIARFGLYLLIPLGSWLGGALVERLLVDLLD